jgi:hypothetical protein
MFHNDYLPFFHYNQYSTFRDICQEVF